MVFVPCAVALEGKQPSASQSDNVEQANDDTDISPDYENPLAAGYEKKPGSGLFIRSMDDNFFLNIGLFTQLRYDISRRDTAAEENDVEREFSMNRTQFFLQGHYTPRLDYHFRANIDDEGESSLLLAFLQYNSTMKWNLRVGRQFIAMSREDWMWGEDTLTTEFSPNDSTFALGASTGVQTNYQAERIRFWLSINDGKYGATKASLDNEKTGTVLTGRWEYQLSGSDWSVWDNLVGRRGQSKGILLGLGGGYQFGEDSSGFDNISQLFADISFNGDGYQAMLSGSLTSHEPVDADSFSNYGLLLQGGYFMADHWQAYGQYNYISPGDQAGTSICSPPLCGLEPFSSIAGGVSYFPFAWTNRWKFSAELGYLFSALNKTIVQPSESLGWLSSNEAGQSYFRIQAQLGF